MRSALASFGLLTLLAASCGEAAPPSEVAVVQGLAPLPSPAPRARLELPVAGKPEGVLFVDLDGDGRDELLVATKNPAALWSWERPPSGWELAPAPEGATVPGYPLGPVALRAEPSGNPTVAVAARENDRLVTLTLPESSGGVRSDQELGARPRALGAGDVDGDGIDELAVVTADGRLHFWAAAVHSDPPPDVLQLGEGDACCIALLGGNRVAVGFQGSHSARVIELDSSRETTIELDGIPRAIAEVELDGERLLAIAGGDRSLWLFERTEDGAYVETRALETGAIPLRLAPTRDGRGLYVLEYDSLALRLLERDGLEGGAPRLVEYAGQTPWDLARGDWNGDGFDDLAFANRDAQRVSVLFGAPDGELRRPERAAVGRAPHALAAGDLDGDGLPEVATVDSLSATITLLRNEGGALRKARAFPSGEGADHARMADLDGDGALDLAWTARDAGGARLVVAFGAGDGTLGSPLALSDPTLVRSASDLALGDIDGDGRLEAWIADRDGGGVVGLRLAASGAARLVASSMTRLELAGGPNALALVALPEGARLAVAAGDGSGPSGVALCAWRDGALAIERTMATGLEPLALHAGDSDGDGVPELALLGRKGPTATTGELRVLRRRADGEWDAVARLATGQRPFDVKLGDLDGDGRAELVASAQNSHHVNLWLARDGGYVAACDLGAGAGPLELLLVDLDDDGALELLVANAFSDDVSLIRFR